MSVGETGDFKYVTPNADITGLVTTIYTMMDMLRINHGLRPKHKTTQTGSGYNATLEKLGVVEKNKKRSQLFKEREQQLFQVVKKMWNIHHAQSGEEKFSEDCELDIHYVEPEFAVDPQTRMAALKQEQEIISTGDTTAIKKIKPHLDDSAIKELIMRYHKDRLEQTQRDMEIERIKAETMAELGIELESDTVTKLSGGGSKGESANKPQPKANVKKSPAQHSKDSSIQPKKNGDPRNTLKDKRRSEQAKKQPEIAKKD